MASVLIVEDEEKLARMLELELNEFERKYTIIFSYDEKNPHFMFHAPPPLPRPIPSASPPVVVLSLYYCCTIVVLSFLCFQ